MTTDAELEQLSRDELVARARALGARRPEVMTRVELRDEIVRLSETDPQARRRSRGWLGVARDLVASVVDNGLNLPGAAAAIRGEAKAEAAEWQGPPPVATLTLAEIYLAQGHYDRALAVVAEVLANEPDHAAGLALRARIEADRNGPHSRRRASAFASEPPPTPIPPAPAPAPIEPPRARAVEASEEDEEDEEDEDRPTLPSEAAMSLAPEATASPPQLSFDEALAAASESATTLSSELSPEHESLAAQGSELLPTPTARAVTHDASVEPAPETPPSGTVPVAAPEVAAECALLLTTSGVDAIVSLTPFVAGSVLRVVWFVPNAGQPQPGELDIALEPARPRFSLPTIPPTAFVRAALGVHVGGGFQPLAVAWVYSAVEHGLRVAFAPPGAEPLTVRAELEELAAARAS
jgi:hypothetical protein